jgi:hypothetical protein
MISEAIMSDMPRRKSDDEVLAEFTAAEIYHLMEDLPYLASACDAVLTDEEQEALYKAADALRPLRDHLLRREGHPPPERHSDPRAAELERLLFAEGWSPDECRRTACEWLTKNGNDPMLDEMMDSMRRFVASGSERRHKS